MPICRRWELSTLMNQFASCFVVCDMTEIVHSDCRLMGSWVFGQAESVCVSRRFFIMKIMKQVRNWTNQLVQSLPDGAGFALTYLTAPVRSLSEQMEAME